MPASVEDSADLPGASHARIRAMTVDDTPGSATAGNGEPATAEGPHHDKHHEKHHHDHEILIDPEEDRWRWRRKIRQNPRQLAVYRIGVGLLGLLLILAGLATGWIPGPGGIPLILLGLAVWSSEFHWANKLMQWFKDQLKAYRAWPRSRQVTFWVVFFAGCGLLGYGYMLALGVPGWLPNSVEFVLNRLPGL